MESAKVKDKNALSHLYVFTQINITATTTVPPASIDDHYSLIEPPIQAEFTDGNSLSATAHALMMKSFTEILIGLSGGFCEEFILDLACNKRSTFTFILK